MPPNKSTQPSPGKKSPAKKRRIGSPKKKNDNKAKQRSVVFKHTLNEEMIQMKHEMKELKAQLKKQLYMFGDHLCTVLNHLNYGNHIFTKWQVANEKLKENNSKNEMEFMNKRMEMINQQSYTFNQLQYKIRKEMDTTFGEDYAKKFK